MHRIAVIGAHRPFLDVLARRWLAEAGDDPLAVGDGLILLPTRRAVRALGEAFLRATGGKPTLLPRIAALGAADETPFALTSALALRPSVTAPQRLALLSRLILKLEGRGGAPQGADRAWPLAGALAQLLDEAARAEIDLGPQLAALVPGQFAEHWQKITVFLRIVTEGWPAILAEAQLSDIGAHAVALLRAQIAEWQANPPATRVWAAGSTGGIGAVAGLLAVVARLPQGQLVLPGLDLAMPEEAWQAIAPGHPQASLQNLLVRIGATRSDVEVWDQGPDRAPPSRAQALNLALWPAAFLPRWREAPPCALGELRLIAAADPQEEALAIAIALRDGLEQPAHRVALITPDRDLAARVVAALARFGVIADDSAGEPLADTPPAVFLRLLIEAVLTGLSPVGLLALLKHPLAAFGMAPGACREAARRLERSALRGAAPGPGLAALRRLPNRAPGTDALLDALERVLSPLMALLADGTLPPSRFLDQLIAAAEAAADRGDGAGPAQLWALEEGEALAGALAELRPAFAQLPPQAADALGGLFTAALAGRTVRSRRALRGRNDGAEHPRVFVWGLLEARLQSVDLAVLGGLSEATWPPAPDPGPWMNRKMRADAGLPSAEEPITQAAHDFVMAACAAPQVVLSFPARRDGAPVVMARWLTRLDALLRGWGRTLEPHPALAWARCLDHCPEASPVPRPEPRPPVAARPRSLSVSDVELWFNDPYGLYAKRILGLKRLDPLEQDADQADFGTRVHQALAQFYTDAGAVWPEDAAHRLASRLGEAFDRAGLRPAIVAWWRPRLARIAAFIDQAETTRRAASPAAERRFEIDGTWQLADGLTLHARADRIERLESGAVAIIDYKTGAPPSETAVRNGYAPQLPLEGMMAQLGGFGPTLAGEVHELAFWRLSGLSTPGEIRSLWSGKAAGQRGHTEAACDDALAALSDLVRRHQDPAQPYRSAPDPHRNHRYSDYARLARRAEWVAAEDDEPEA